MAAGTSADPAQGWIKHMYLAEFDIDRGSTIRACVPSPVHICRTHTHTHTSAHTRTPTGAPTADTHTHTHTRAHMHTDTRADVGTGTQSAETSNNIDENDPKTLISVPNDSHTSESVDIHANPDFDLKNEKFPVPVPDAFFAERMLPEGAHSHARDATIFYVHEVAAQACQGDLTLVSSSSEGRQSHREDATAVTASHTASSASVFRAPGAGSALPAPGAATGSGSALPASATLGGPAGSNSNDRDDDAAAVAVEDGREHACSYVCVSVSQTRLDASVRRGAVVKALCVVMPLHAPLTDALRPLLHEILDEAFGSTGIKRSDDASVWLRDQLHRLNALLGILRPLTSRTRRAVLRGLLPLACKSLSAVTGRVRPPPRTPAPAAATTRVVDETDMSAALKGSATPGGDSAAAHHIPATSRASAPGASLVNALAPHAFQEITWDWGEKATATLTQPLFVEPQTCHSASTSALVQRFGADVMKIYNAVLAEKRVLFLGTRGTPAVEVVNAVLACGHMVCPPVRTISRRMFPYATLNDLEFLSVPGYIAGVTNPLFETKQAWWDLLCVVGPRTAGGAVITASSTLSATVLRLVRTGTAASGDDASAGETPLAVPSASSNDTAPIRTVATQPTGGELAAPAPSAPRSGDASRRTVGAGGEAPAGPSVAELQAQCSRVVLARADFFDWMAPHPAGDGPSTSSKADAAAPAAAGIKSPPIEKGAEDKLSQWKQQDSIFFRRLRSGLKFGEHWIRAAFEQYTTALLRLTLALQQHVLSPTPAATGGLTAQQRAFIDLHLPRLHVLVQTRGFAEFRRAAEEVAARSPGLALALTQLRTAGSLPGIAGIWASGTHPAELLKRRGEADGAADEAPTGDWHDALQLLQPPPDPTPDTPEGDMIDMLAGLEVALAQPAAVERFLAAFPEYAGGLHPVATALLHADVRVRAAGARILRIFELHPWFPVQCALRNLNFVFQSALNRHRTLPTAMEAKSGVV